MGINWQGRAAAARNSGTEGSQPGSSMLQIAAAGDLILSGEWSQVAREGREHAVFGELTSILQEALLFVNLETTILTKEGQISKAPLVFAEPDVIERALQALNVRQVSLANNHIFDSGAPGFRSIRRLLDKLGMGYFGAGDNIRDASRPVICERDGIRLAWLGFAASDTGLSHAANEVNPGVNVLEGDKALSQIKTVKGQVDHVIVSLHWGVEYCHVPSPSQVRLARSFVDAGARVIIGHHAHVIQGVETYRNGLIAYNLGNLTTTDFFIKSRRAIRQNDRTRSSLLLRLDFSKNELLNFELLPLRQTPDHLLVADEKAQKYLNRANRLLARGVTETRWRRRRVFEDVVLRTLRKLHPSVVGSLRPHHFFKLFQNLSLATRGKGPA